MRQLATNLFFQLLVLCLDFPTSPGLCPDGFTMDSKSGLGIQQCKAPRRGQRSMTGTLPAYVPIQGGVHFLGSGHRLAEYLSSTFGPYKELHIACCSGYPDEVMKLKMRVSILSKAANLLQHIYSSFLLLPLRCCPIKPGILQLPLQHFPWY